MKKTTKKKVVKATKVPAAKPRRRTSVAMTNEINRRFDFVSSVSKEKTEDCIAVRAAVKKLARQIAMVTPVGREQAMALTELEDALHYAIAGIVRPLRGE